MRAIAIAFIVLLIASSCSAETENEVSSAEPFDAIANLPAQPDGPVLDDADLLPPLEEAKLVQKLSHFNSETGDALVFVTLKSLGGVTIENMAFNVFNNWGIGGSDTDRGILLLVVPNERKLRIEVGCGLESTVPDVIAARIIRSEITPLYKQGDFVGGTLGGVEALMDRMKLPRPANDPGPHSPLCFDQDRRAA